MNFLFAVLVLVALLAVAFAQWPYYSTYTGVAYPYAYHYNNPAVAYVWK